MDHLRSRLYAGLLAFQTAFSLPLPFETGPGALPLPLVLPGWNFLALLSAKVGRGGRGSGLGISRLTRVATHQRFWPTPAVASDGQMVSDSGMTMASHSTHLNANTEEDDSGTKPLASGELVVE